MRAGSMKSSAALRAAGIPHRRAADRPQAEGALAHPHQRAGYVLRARRQDPHLPARADVQLAPGETYTVRAKRPHLVTNAGESSATFLVLQGVGEYDFVPLT
jgi:hypothetical protein